MLNIIWASMIVIGVVWAAFHGNIAAVTQGLLDSAAETVSLCVTMLGVVSMWSGILKIAERSGLVDRLARVLEPVLRFLFPRLPEDHPARRSIAVNMIANILGLGWAATPAGLQAMKELAQLEEERREAAACVPGKEHLSQKAAAPSGTASREMCTFLIINISSLQLIPMNMIAYRAEYGSAAPAAIVGPAIAATTASTLAAVVFCRVMDHKRAIISSYK